MQEAHECVTDDKPNVCLGARHHYFRVSGLAAKVVRVAQDMKVASEHSIAVCQQSDMGVVLWLNHKQPAVRATCCAGETSFAMCFAHSEHLLLRQQSASRSCVADVDPVNLCVRSDFVGYLEQRIDAVLEGFTHISHKVQTLQSFQQEQRQQILVFDRVCGCPRPCIGLLYHLQTCDGCRALCSLHARPVTPTHTTCCMLLLLAVPESTTKKIHQHTKSNGSIKHGLVSVWNHCMQNAAAPRVSPNREQPVPQVDSTEK